jgi:hypothetical protein
VAPVPAAVPEIVPLEPEVNDRSGGFAWPSDESWIY